MERRPEIRPRLHASTPSTPFTVREHSSQLAIASAWVEFAVEAAFAKEEEKHALVLVPIRLDHAVMQCTTSWAAQLKRMRHMTDFTGWKHHDDYQKALTHLLGELQAETPPAESTR